MKKVTKCNYVICGNYNGFLNVRLMMKSDDFRLTDVRFKDNYKIIDDSASYKRGALHTKDGIFTVHSDWSLTKLTKS